MALYTSRPSVGTTATPIAPDSDPRADGRPGSSVVVYNPGPTEVFLGNDSVTTTTGFSLPSGATFQAELDDTDRLHGIVAAGTQTVHVLKTGI